MPEQQAGHRAIHAVAERELPCGDHTRAIAGREGKNDAVVFPQRAQIDARDEDARDIDEQSGREDREHRRCVNEAEEKHATEQRGENRGESDAAFETGKDAVFLLQ